MKKTLIAVVVVCAAVLGYAKTCVWTGAAGGNYIYANNAANWQDEQVPADGDTVVMSTTSGGTIVYNLKSTFENFYFTNTCGGTLSADGGTVKVSGTDSKVVNVQAGGIFFYCPFYVETGARLEFVEKEGHISFAGGKPFNGAGEFTLSGEKGDCGISVGSPDFHGTLNLRRGVIFTSSGQLNDPFGASDAVVNVYGDSTDPAFAGCSATLTSYRPVRFSNKFNFYHGTSMTMNPQQTGDVLATYDGDVVYTAGGGQSVFKMNIYGGADSRVGHVFNGDMLVKNGGCLQTINYGKATYHLEFKGKVCLSDSSTAFFDPSMATAEATAAIYFGGEYTTGHDCLLNQKERVHYFMTAPNVLNSSKQIWSNYSSSERGNTYDSVLDLQGFDQKVGYVRNWGTNNDRVNNAVITSTGRPATLNTQLYPQEATCAMPMLDGLVSLYIRGATSLSAKFQNTNGTSGWLVTDYVSLDLSDRSFANLGGIDFTGNAQIVVNAATTLNANMTLDAHGLESGKGVRVVTGKDVNVKHVFYDGVDLPAGKYCRVGAGTAPNEATWMVSGAEGEDGTVTIADHDPVWIWTGKGSNTSFTDAANWGANAAPDLTNAKLTLNLKNAAGNEGMIVPLDGTIAPVCAFNCGDYSRGAVMFGGDGALVLGGADADFKMVFTEASSFTWNGPGTLCLTGKSTSTGTLTVNGGKVILDHAGWAGNIIVAKGAELVVNTSCGDRAFGAETELDLDGKLALDGEIALSVHALYIDGALARHGKTYGSEASSAEKKDAIHFNGAGTIVSSLKGGVLLIIR